MGVEIPFRRELRFEYGEVAELSGNIRRVIANNPGPFTLHGTGTYILGRGNVAVIDPGPPDPGHIEAIKAATVGERITHVLVTHTHMDHSPGCRLLREATDADTYGYGPHGAGKIEQGVPVEEGGDMDFAPDVKVSDGDVIEGDGWSVECVYTPGHTSNHICYQLREERALFTGDHVMGWSTSIVSPPDGDMKSYMASLRRLLERNDTVYWPTHGPADHATQTACGSIHRPSARAGGRDSGVSRAWHPEDPGDGADHVRRVTGIHVPRCGAKCLCRDALHGRTRRSALRRQDSPGRVI